MAELDRRHLLASAALVSAAAALPVAAFSATTLEKEPTP
jgi:hypothetical protein